MMRLNLFIASLAMAAMAAAAIPSWEMDTPQPGSVSLAAPMLQPRSGHSATLLTDGRVLVVGGMRRNQDFYKSAELYDPATGTFLPGAEMSIARVGHVAVLLRSGRVLIAGGWVGGGCTDSAELYDPSTEKFTVIAKMTSKRGRPSATLLSNGVVQRRRPRLSGGNGFGGGLPFRRNDFRARRRHALRAHFSHGYLAA